MSSREISKKRKKILLNVIIPIGMVICLFILVFLAWNNNKLSSEGAIILENKSSYEVCRPEGKDVLCCNESNYALVNCQEFSYYIENGKYKFMEVGCDR